MIHQQLGIRPFLNYGELLVIPRVPRAQPSVAGSHIRLGTGSVAVFAAHSGSTYVTRVDATGLRLGTLLVGHTLPRALRPLSVALDGHRVRHYRVQLTSRGVEVTVAADPQAGHTLTITAG